ncbi:Sodium:solute symporter family-domain-containing protein [Apiospora hydei]|uniref:Sodium:solute symporter family-domain-containing protein n=1 Tax=Apiospora hydei TaxID=1337664 RepID=A0ABR1VTB1_9PEZI
MASISQVGALIPQATAYGLLIGLGILFCAIILLAVKLQKAYLAEDSGTSEMFMVANRSVGTGLTASAVFSSWMWINETVLAAAMCYRYGLAVPLWWGSGLCFQIALMAALGVMAKIRVPYAHTSLEIIRMRYGNIAHVVFIVMNLGNNVFGCASMILTGSQLIHGVSGMHFVAATATFLTDFLHTAVALVLIIYFTLTVLTHSAAGYMTSRMMLLYGADSQVWKLGFGRDGYNLAALAVFGIPWGLGTVIGLTGRALHNTALFPTYPGAVTELEVSEGLIMPYVIKALIGDRGIVAFFVLLFMALTSTISSSMIAVSSILSFDLYKTYLNPRATDKRLVHVSHLTVVIHGFVITAVSLGLNYGGANMTWIGYFRPVLSCPGIVPLALTLLWSGQTRTAAIVSPYWALYGRVDMVTTGASLPALFGAIASFFSPALYSVVISLSYRPYKFDWREFLRIELAEEAQIHPASTPHKMGQDSTDEEGSVVVPLKSRPLDDTPTSCPQEKTDNNVEKKAGETTSLDLGGSAEKKEGTKSPRTYYSNKQPSKIGINDVQHPFDAATLVSLHRWHRIAWLMWAAIVLVTFILWPMPLYRDYIFSKSFFSGWVSVAIVWQFFAFSAVVIYPLYDGRYEIAKSAVGLWRAVAVVLGKDNKQGRAVETQ